MNLETNTSFTIDNTTYTVKRSLLFLINNIEYNFYEGTFQDETEKFWIFLENNSFLLYTKPYNDFTPDDSNLIITKEVTWKNSSRIYPNLNGTLKRYRFKNKYYELFHFDNNENFIFSLKKFNSPISKYINPSQNENNNAFTIKEKIIIFFAIIIFIIYFYLGLTSNSCRYHFSSY